MRLRFLTSTPLDISRGSGTYVGISTLANSLRALGAEVEFVTPKIHLPIYTAERIFFNQLLRLRRLSPVDATIGFDMDGYTLSGKHGLHIASIKGVIADELRFERGLTQATMRIQAHCEKIHAQTSQAVITTSNYSAQRIQELYKLPIKPHIVPELIDLETWNKLLEKTQRVPHPSRVLGERARPEQAQRAEGVGNLTSAKFTILTVCRFYPRKRLHILLEATALLRNQVPNLEVRIIGGGPEAPRLKRMCQEENLQGIVHFRENISQEELIAEYKSCDVFCLPSVQEGFGIVFLEAMATGKPIVAARAAAVPEVVQHGILAEPGNAESLAASIERLYHDASLGQSLAAAGKQFVEQFDAPRVAATFLRTLESIGGKKS